jgi:glycine/serine hydroxymethyltransferase
MRLVYSGQHAQEFMCMRDASNQRRRFRRIAFDAPAVTTRGFKQDQCRALAGWICEILANLYEAVAARIREQVKALCARFPVYGN